MLWKYSMILVHVDSTDSNDTKETCKLVEVYDREDGEGFASYCHTSLLCPEELQRAAKDVDKEGVNEWFYNIGVFSQDSHGQWHWEKYLPLDKALVECGDIETYEDEIELYTIYGGD